MAALISLSTRKNLVNNCLYDSHPELARRCFPAPFQDVSESAQGQQGWVVKTRKCLGIQWELDLLDKPTLPLTPCM